MNLYMLKRFSGSLYGNQLRWMMERDSLDASFQRMGSGFMTRGILNEAVATHARINQILIHYQKILESDSSPHPVESLHLPMSEAQKSVPIYVHSKADGNLR